MFGSSSTTSSRASDCARSSVIDVFMIFIIAPFAEGNLNVSSGTAAVFPGYAPRLPRRSRRCALTRFGIAERGRRIPPAAGGAFSGGARRAGLQPVRDGGRTVVHAEFGVDAPDVILDCFLCQEEVSGDLAVGMPACDQRHDLDLAGRQPQAGLLINPCAAHETSG